MKKNRKDESFIKRPYYKGGNDALRLFIQEQMQYPEKALAKKIEGTVRLRYQINVKGKVDDTLLLSKLGYGCDEEAIRLVRLFEFQMPKQRTGKIKFFKTINIHFRLPKPKKKKAALEVQYELSKEKPKNNSYSYTIDM